MNPVSPPAVEPLLTTESWITDCELWSWKKKLIMLVTKKKPNPLFSNVFWPEWVIRDEILERLALIVDIWCETGRQSLSWSLTNVTRIWCFFQPTEKTAFDSSEPEQIERAHSDTGQNLSELLCRHWFAFLLFKLPLFTNLVWRLAGWDAESESIWIFDTIRIACQTPCLQCDWLIKDFISV